jgi:hypothetical protein
MEPVSAPVQPRRGHKMAWGVQSLQAVWFTTGQPITTPAGDLYRAIVGTPAGATQNLPVGNLAVAMGNVGTNSYRVQVAAARIDYSLIPAPPPQARGVHLNLPTNVDLAIDEFMQQVHRGSLPIGGVIRLALVTNISHETSDTRESIALISTHTGVTIPFDDGSDLLLQINRRLGLRSVSGTEVNRLMKWSAEEVQTIGVMPGSFPSFARVFLATVTIDINIVPTNRPYPPAEQDAIFDEIAIETKRLCAAKSLGALQ